MLKRTFFIITIAALVVLSGFAQAPVTGTDVVMVLPFENTSGKPEFNWVGESFADSLSDLLRVPNLNVITNDQRKLIQQKLRIPLTTLPSLATSLKLARESSSTLLIAGRYNIVPAGADTAATINVTAKIIRVNEGRFMSEVIDGRQITRDINLNDALGNLQTMQGQIAYQILYQRDKSLPFSQNQLIEAANKVPARAFEAYIKGLLTPTVEARENYFKNASRLYTEATPDGVYSEAELELGHLYLSQRKGNDAINSFERVISTNVKCREKAKSDKKPAQCSDENFAEASFYIGLLFLQQGNFESAIATLQPLADDLKLTTVYNALGAISVQASRAEKKNPAKAAAQLTDGIASLKKAADSAPDDANVRFNYAAALFFMGNMTEAADQLRSAIVANPRDGEAYYLLSKTLETLKTPTAADIDNQARRFLTDNNRYANLEKEWQKSHTVTDVSLRVHSRRPAANERDRDAACSGTYAHKKRQRRRGHDDAPARTRQRANERRELSFVGKDKFTPGRHGPGDKPVQNIGLLGQPPDRGSCQPGKDLCRKGRLSASEKLRSLRDRDRRRESGRHRSTAVVGTVLQIECYAQFRVPSSEFQVTKQFDFQLFFRYKSL